MALFKRNDNAPPVPDSADLEQYYATTSSSRMKSVLISVGLLIGVIVLGFALFFGGRWGYRKYENRGKSGVAKVTSTPKPTANPFGLPVKGTDLGPSDQDVPQSSTN